MNTLLTFEQCVERVKAINDKLKANGHNWEEIEQFWAMVFKEAGKPTCTCINWHPSTKRNQGKNAICSYCKNPRNLKP